MSDEDKSYTSILLPAARVALFTTDPQTRAAYEGIAEDWRFARVGLAFQDGDAVTAASFYQSNAAPELVIIQTDSIDESFTDKLESLAAHLSENTAAIVIGPVNDVNLYKRLSAMGVSDYLVRPVTTASLSDDIAKAIIAQVGMDDSRMIAFLGAKGGVGTTVLAETLAWHVSGDFKQKTFFLDAAGGWSTLSVGMGFEPSTTLAEAVRAAATNNEDSLTRMIFKASDKLSILSSGGDVMLDDNVEAETYEVLLGYLMSLYPVVIVDLSGATAALKRVVLTRAHKTFLVTTPTLPSVRAARTLLQEVKQLRGGSIDDVDVVLNMQGFAPKVEVTKAQINEGLERPVSISIPFSPDLIAGAESEARKLGEQKDGAEIVKNLLASVRSLLSIATPATQQDTGKSGIGKLLTKLKAKG